MVEFEPMKFVSIAQLTKFVETWMWPFNPVKSCTLKARPFFFIGCQLVKPSCSLRWPCPDLVDRSPATSLMVV